jgi:PknH-like extracellular domain
MRHRTTALAVAAVCIFAAGCGNGSNQAAGLSATTTTTTSRTAPPVLEPGLNGLLLSPEQVNAVMGATEMTVKDERNTMSDDSATMTPPECLAIDGSVQATVYALSGYIAEREQTLREDAFIHYVKQAVVLFPTVKEAENFFTASTQQWPTCRDYTHTQSGSRWTPGPISNTNDVLSTVATQQNASDAGWACGRALAINNNVIADVNTCSANPADTAVKIANDIAAKVPTWK